MFTIGETLAISHSNATGQRAQQVDSNPRQRREICPEMHALAKMEEMALNCQNSQTVNKNSN